MADKIFWTREGFRINYSGGRLANVYINGVCVECVQVRDYDFATGEFGPEPTGEEIRLAVGEFMNPDDVDNYREFADSINR